MFSPPWRVLQIWRFLGVDTKSFAPQRLHRGSKLVRPSASIMDPSNPFQRFSQETNTIEELSTTSLVPATNQSVSTANVLSALRHNNNDDSDDHATNSHEPSIQPVRPASPTPSNVPYALPRLEQAILRSFTDWHGKTARPWQVNACGEVIKRHTIQPTVSPILRPVLLVRSTGGGKSAVRDVSGFLCGGISITIVPLLSLAADQTSKLTHLSLSQGLHHRLRVFNLDVIRSEKLNTLLRNHLEELSSTDTSKKRVFLFTSPQKITNNPSWQQTIARCCHNGSLRLLAVDECHLYATHGMEFRAEFAELRKCLFKTITRQSKIPLPVLFMTATASSAMVEDLQTLTGLRFDVTQDLIWPNRHSGVHCRNICLDLSFKDTALRRIKAELIKTCQSPNGQKIIVYSNSRKAIQNLHKNCRAEFNRLAIQKDILLVHGTMFREQKFHHTNLFVGKPLSDECPSTGRTLRFDPIALFATAGTASSGIDCADVHKVIFHGIPTSLQDLLQCSGRCGRSPTATPADSSFTIIFSFNNLVSLMTRIFIIPKYEESQKNKDSNTSTSNKDQDSSSLHSKPSAINTLSFDALATRHWTNLLPVLSLLCLNKGGCIHYQLEQAMLHPYHEKVCDMAVCCDGACWRCASPRVSTPLDGRIDKDALQDYFLQIFITRKLPPAKLSLHKECFLNELLQYETLGPDGKPTKVFAKRVFRLKDKRAARQRAKALLLKCFASEILQPEIDGFQLRAKLGYYATGNPRMNCEEVWAGFNLFPST